MSHHELKLNLFYVDALQKIYLFTKKYILIFFCITKLYISWLGIGKLRQQNISSVFTTKLCSFSTVECGCGHGIAHVGIYPGIICKIIFLSSLLHYFWSICVSKISTNKWIIWGCSRCSDNFGDFQHSCFHFYKCIIGLVKLINKLHLD